jgi:hypothetical protein
MAGKDRENGLTMLRKKKNLTTEFHRGKKSFTEYLRETSHQCPNFVLSRSLFTILYSLFILLFLSCQTLPKALGMDIASLEKTGLPLESGAMVYLIADVDRARHLIEHLPIKELKDSHTKQMLEKTDFLVAAMFPLGNERRFQLAAWGNYPSSGAGMAFGINRSWKQLRAASGYSYWYSEAERLSISVTPAQAFAAASANDTPAEPVTTASAVKMPEGFAEFSGISAGGQSSHLSCWLERGDSVINRVLNSSGLPIRFPVRELFIAIFPVEGRKYQGTIRMQFESASQARGMASLLSMANNYIYGEHGGKSLLTAIFFTNPPVVNGNYFDIKTAVLSEGDIVQLFNLFSLF